MVSSVLLRFLNGDPIIRSSSRGGSAVETGYRRETKGLGMTGRGYVEIGSENVIGVEGRVQFGCKEEKKSASV